MYISKWAHKRGAKFLWQRGKRLLQRYDLSGARAEKRIRACMQELAACGCRPSFAVPASVVERRPVFAQALIEQGAELAVHGYRHLDLTNFAPQEARRQLLQAANIYETFHLPVHGFRCPYLSCTQELIDCLPPGVFTYSSNQAIQWPLPAAPAAPENTLVEKIEHFYTPLTAESQVCLPWRRGGLIEIPVCVPDDIQLFDGYTLNTAAVAVFWLDLLESIYRQGELFTLMFHPELYDLCSSPVLALIDAAQQRTPPVWIARLDEIAQWWLEKSRFQAAITCDGPALRAIFDVSPRATLLLRDPASVRLGAPALAQTWQGRYARLALQPDASLELSSAARPLVGIAPDLPAPAIDFLLEQGYLLDRSPSAQACTIYLDEAFIGVRPNRRNWIEAIESCPGPLLRFWPWPDGCRSALSISGDLDALSLLDYGSRLVHNWNRG
jgi:peptidoglycan/xylan/chitin deacetylase (PgdA/CDA1 family)